MLIKNLKPKFPKIKYVSIGFGKEEDNLLKLAKELSVEKDVTFLKNIDYNFKTALIAEANLFLMPSRIEKKSVEGFGISFIDSTPIQVCNPKRISRNKVFKNTAKIGKSTIGWFFGFNICLY